MTWVRLDDDFCEHPKVVGMGDLAPLAGWQFVCILAYCNRYLTDGHIAEVKARALVPWSHIGIVVRGRGSDYTVSEEPDGEFLCSALVEAGLLQDCETHRACWLVHDFLDYQPSKAQIEAEREANRTRAARARHARTNGVTNGRTNGVTNGVTAPVIRSTRTRPVPLIEVPNGTSHVVFELWRVETKRPLARLTTKRARLLRDRLKDGYDEDYLCDTVRGVARDPWVERPRFNDLTDILKSGESVEKFHDLWVNGPPVMAAKPLTENPVDRRIRESFSHLTHNGDRP